MQPTDVDLVIDSPGLRRFLPRRLGRKTVAVVAIGLLLFSAWSSTKGNWSFLHDFSWRIGVKVVQAQLRSPDTLVLNVASCNGDPEVVLLRETDDKVQVKVVTSSFPFRGGGDDCGDAVKIQLQEPFGDRILVDRHTGRPVNVRPGVSVLEVRAHSPDRLTLFVVSCNRDPQVTALRETDVDVQIMVVASSAAVGSRDDCQASVGVQLQEPLGDRLVVDMNTGEPVTVRRRVKISEAELQSPDRLRLLVGSCRGNPKISVLLESDVDVQVEVVASSTPMDCLEYMEVLLREPLGDRVVVDIYTGETVSVKDGPGSADHASGEDGDLPDVAPPEINDPPNEAELQDLQAVADQYGISLQEAIDRYAWNDNFSLLAAKIRNDFPAAFAGAAIVDAGGAWIAFAGPAPEAALDMIDLFSSSHSGVSIEVRAGIEFTEAELQKAIPAAHYAVYESPEVRDATTSFDYATGRITTTVILESAASDSVLDDLQIAARKAIIDATRAGFLDSITYSVVRSNRESLGGLD